MPKEYRYSGNNPMVSHNLRNRVFLHDNMRLIREFMDEHYQPHKITGIIVKSKDDNIDLIEFIQNYFETYIVHKYKYMDVKNCPNHNQNYQNHQISLSLSQFQSQKRIILENFYPINSLKLWYMKNNDNNNDDDDNIDRSIKIVSISEDSSPHLDQSQSIYLGIGFLIHLPFNQIIKMREYIDFLAKLLCDTKQSYLLTYLRDRLGICYSVRYNLITLPRLSLLTFSFCISKIEISIFRNEIIPEILGIFDQLKINLINIEDIKMHLALIQNDDNDHTNNDIDFKNGKKNENENEIFDRLTEYVSNLNNLNLPLSQIPWLMDAENKTKMENINIRNMNDMNNLRIELITIANKIFSSEFTQIYLETT
jgi:hypothetical protein